MKKTKLIALFIAIVVMIATLAACDGSQGLGSTKDDIDRTQRVVDDITKNQPTPTDIEYSLERYNLIRRAYWVNGQREKAMTLPCSVEKPLGYVVLLTPSGAVVGRFIVDGKVTSLNSFLTPNMFQDCIHSHNNGGGGCVIETELPDIDGSYGSNDDGIFFFTPNGNYIEWTGIYIYSDIPFEIDDPIVKVG